MDLVAGKKRVPKPATGKIAFLIGFITGAAVIVYPWRSTLACGALRKS
jgi:hypothetical protein